VTIRLGIDIGGSGVKGAPVDLDTAQFTEERLRFETPHPATPEAVATTVTAVAANFGAEGTIACTFPGIVQQGVIRSAANMDQENRTTLTSKLTSAAMIQPNFGQKPTNTARRRYLFDSRKK